MINGANVCKGFSAQAGESEAEDGFLNQTSGLWIFVLPLWEERMSKDEDRADMLIYQLDNKYKHSLPGVKIERVLDLIHAIQDECSDRAIAWYHKCELGQVMRAVDLEAAIMGKEAKE